MVSDPKQQLEIIDKLCASVERIYNNVAQEIQADHDSGQEGPIVPPRPASNKKANQHRGQGGGCLDVVQA